MHLVYYVLTYYTKKHLRVIKVYCTNCGNLISNDAKFCTKCGTAVNPPSQADVSQPIKENAPYCLYMDAKGLTLLNYKFDIKLADGTLRYRAATVSESLVAYNAKIYNPDDTEALIIRQQKKLTLAAMNFDIFSPDGTLITEVLQKVHFTKSEFQLPKLGLVVSGDFLSINFNFTLYILTYFYAFNNQKNKTLPK